ncbi:hypothetical protein BU14_0058s0086 [Porphyra umbilicalis]|uniref:Uncharacterized protein n=1 Tax=Porphyra umbilicalis TaxID=2786 RepID=A0A1X6PHG9_PORUM|nr:hypothetical protein BU14_0058s0086 [Porphyra umbilicalis]|eukprot:OSX80176.1 hypothetical protein BU14_0058s0086 [Porphyra umbilicalis]
MCARRHDCRRPRNGEGGGTAVPAAAQRSPPLTWGERGTGGRLGR